MGRLDIFFAARGLGRANGEGLALGGKGLLEVGDRRVVGEIELGDLPPRLDLDLHPWLLGGGRSGKKSNVTRIIFYDFLERRGRAGRMRAKELRAETSTTSADVSLSLGSSASRDDEK